MRTVSDKPWWIGLSLILISSFTLPLRAETLHNAQITVVHNDVKLGTVGASSLTSAKVNDTVAADNLVRTGTKSRAELKFNDDSIARLGSYTVFTFNKGTRELNLAQGSLLIDVAKGQGKTTVVSGGITAAITGSTGLFQSVKAKDYSALYVLDGTFNANRGKLTPGQALIRNKGQFKVIRFRIQKLLRSSPMFTAFSALPSAQKIAKNAQSQDKEQGPATPSQSMSNEKAVYNRSGAKVRKEGTLSKGGTTDHNQPLGT